MEHIVKQGILECLIPDNALPVIIDSPHSGRYYPDDFGYNCTFEMLEKIEDRYVEDLFSNAPAQGATLLFSHFPRSYIDVNRAADDIDDSLIKGIWNTRRHGKISPTSRSGHGIGLISRLVKPGIPVYERYLEPEEIKKRIEEYYRPYHDILKKVLDESYYKYGQFWHINCHSMPSASAYPKNSIALAGSTPQPSDIVLGDRDGRTCNRDFLHLLRDYWKNLGYRVTINDPYKGVELVSRYSQPTRDKNSVQIEINRALYMNEDTGDQNKNYQILKSHCDDMIALCIAFAREKLTPMAAD